MEPKVMRYQLEPWVDLADDLRESAVLSMNIGFDNHLYLMATEPPFERARWGLIRRIGLDTPLKTFVLHIDTSGNVIERRPIDGHGYDAWSIQPLPDDQFLVDCSSGSIQSGDSTQIQRGDGSLVRGINLGYSAVDVQSTRNGDIWVGYSDEAYANEIFGVARWDINGRCQFMVRETIVMDCYALNVTGSDDTWFYAYTPFKLVHLHRDREVGYWEFAFKGIHSFAIWRHLGLFDGGYKRSNDFCLAELNEDHTITERGWYQFVNTDDEVIEPEQRAMRGSQMIMLSGTKLYRVTIEELQEH
jgi:hypothetical protein